MPVRIAPIFFAPTLLILLGGCPQGDGPIRIHIHPDDIGPACAGYTACTNHMVGFGACYISIDSARYWDVKAMSFDLATRIELEWINILSGIQNTSCFAQAGGDCEKVVACTNQGNVIRGCTPPPGHFGGRYCKDENTLAACTKTSSDGNTVETSLRCNDVGMKCVEFDRENDTLAACGHWAEDTVDGISVTCKGTMARVQRKNVYFHWDCGLMNARCREGTYLSWDNYDFCDSDGPACDLATMKKHCDGSTMLGWCNQKETGVECKATNRTCEETMMLGWVLPMCVYADAGCNPYNFEEECNDGVITYCHENGVANFSCRTAGYSNCVINLVFAQCRE